ncbi:TatD family hydrolase [Patescibacteria group bacterium]
MLVDSHCHLNFKDFTDDYQEVIARTQKRGMKVVVVGSQLETSQRAVKLAQDFDNVYAAVGLHPTHVTKHQFDITIYQKLAAGDKVVALGETGLDYYRLPADTPIDEYKKRQRSVFADHWAIAASQNLPLILHCRDAYDDLLAMIRDMGAKSHPPGVIHCFIGTVEQAQQFVDLGFYVGLTGIVTFKNPGTVAQVAENIPLEKLLIETDSPYLAPVPHRGHRNEPIYVEQVASKIAELKGLDKTEVIETTSQNAIELFKLN